MRKTKPLPSCIDREYNVSAVISAVITRKNKAEEEYSAGRDDISDM